ncbi:MAG: type II toxin-antitoxin system RelE/ParE family toxin [Candidatus Riflebacteria bacterium]|nr:type II toxin-antitoxin system RelE/ParE family toxin [Candidatus Riflebacteria bacterium]
MEFEFSDKHLKTLYETGQDKKLRLPQGLAQKFVERVNRIEAAVTIYDLRIPPSMAFESLDGYENRFSIRINDQYRLIFEIDFRDRERTFGKVSILKISKHYED